MNELTRDECRWKFRESVVSEPDLSVSNAWETGCGQWCNETESTPHADGFRNGFLFCPYCSRRLLLILNREAA